MRHMDVSLLPGCNPDILIGLDERHATSRIGEINRGPRRGAGRNAVRDWSVNRAYWTIPIMIWGVVAFVSYQWNANAVDRHAQEMAAAKGRLVFQLVETIRLWNARHGGVYALIKDETQPNPYLKVPERELTTPSGAVLTKVNPAYMTRQLGELMATGELNIHLTSLKPLNPNNKADPWEASALSAFEQGQASEAVAVVVERDRPTFRYMAPLLVRKPCMACHEQQGYRIGDVRGGLRVSFPAGPILEATMDQKRTLAWIHGGAWLLLSLVTLLALEGVRREVLSLEQEKSRRQTIIDERTASLTREIADRQRSEQALVESETMIRLLLESVGAGIFAIDPEGTCTMCNPAALHMLGYGADTDVLGQRFHDLVQHARADGSHVAYDDCPTAKVLHTGEPINVHNDLFFRADGTAFPVEYYAYPIRGGGGIVGAVVSFFDISERRAMELRLHRSNAELQQFAYAISHDLQEPLRAVAAYAKLMREDYGDRLDAVASEYLSSMVEGTSRMERMIRDLLTYARIDSQGVEPDEVDAAAAMEEALTNLRATIAEAGAIVEVAPLPLVLADAGQLARLFQNLVGNAVKYRHPDRAPVVRVKAEREGAWWRVSVTDNGIGIEAKHFERVFGVFQRLHGRSAYDGTGIGLAVCKRIVERLGGRIWLESTPGEGTTVLFTVSAV